MVKYSLRSKNQHSDGIHDVLPARKHILKYSDIFSHNELLQAMANADLMPSY